MTNSNPFDFMRRDYWLYLDQKPLVTMRMCQGDFLYLQDTSNAAKYRLIAITGGFVLKLWEDPELLRAFRAEPLWQNKPYALKEGNLPTHAVQYLMGIPSLDLPRGETVRKYGQALRILLDRGVEPRCIEAELARLGGVRGVVRSAQGSKHAEKAGELGDKVTGDPGLNAGETGRAGDAQPDYDPFAPDDLEAGEGRCAAADEVAASKARSPRIFDRDRHIAVDWCDRRAEFFSLDIGEWLWAKIQRDPDEGDVARFRVVEVDPYGL